MHRPLCLIHANCQGDSLQYLLNATPTFAREFEIKSYTNYLREDIFAEDMTRCALLLYQPLVGDWGEHGIAPLLARLPASATSLQIPNMFFNGYWPLWTNATPMAYGDMLLEHLAGLGLSAAEILRVYLKADIAAMYDLPALMAASRLREEAKEEGCIVRTLPVIDELWQREQLFYTVNHPGPRLSIYVADGVLRTLGMPPVPQEIRAVYRQWRDEFEMPLHPRVGTEHSLPFAGEARAYAVYGQKLTFAQYAAAYVDCRLRQKAAEAAGEVLTEDMNFVVYLHLLANQQGTISDA